MSKSDPDPKSRIELTDDADAVVEKCKKAMTDFTSAVTFEPEKRPAVANLLTLHSLCSGLDPGALCHRHSHQDTAQYKLAVAESVNEFLQPIRLRYVDLMKNPDHLSRILDRGSEKAADIAEKTWTQVKRAVGMTVS